MLTFRPITLRDVEPMIELAREALPAEQGGTVSVQKIRDVVSFFAMHFPYHFQIAAFRGEKPVAGLALLVAEMPFHEQMEGTVMFCYSKEPGAGATLMRSMMRWVDAHDNIRRVTWCQNIAADPRIARFAARLGFTSSFPTLMFSKGA